MPTEFDQQKLFNDFTKFMNSHDIVPSKPNKAIGSLGCIMGMCAKVIDEVNGTQDCLHSIHDVSIRAYENANFLG